jgi:hypothetical protein
MKEQAYKTTTINSNINTNKDNIKNSSNNNIIIINNNNNNSSSSLCKSDPVSLNERILAFTARDPNAASLSENRIQQRNHKTFYICNLRFWINNKLVRFATY